MVIERKRGRPKKVTVEDLLVDGELDVRKYLSDPKVKMLLLNSITDGLKGKKINSALLKLFTQLTGDLIEKKEDIVKLEYSVSDITRDANEIIAYLRERYEEAGVCSVCLRPRLLLEEVCDNQIN